MPDDRKSLSPPAGYSESMWKVLVMLLRGPSTCALVGQMLVGKNWRKPQSCAREGGSTLRALERRGLVARDVFYGDPRTFWRLTSKGLTEARAVLVSKDVKNQ
jgi:hypothetical protein